MSDRYPWDNTTNNAASEDDPRYETPGGAQAKADQAEQDAKDYSDAKLALPELPIANGSIVERHIRDENISTRTIAQKAVTRSKIGTGAVGAQELDPTLLQNYGDIAVQAKFVEVDEQLTDIEQRTVNVESYPIIIPELDDTARVNRALADTKADIVLFAKKTYNIGNKMNLRSNLTIIGQGDETLINITSSQKLGFDGDGLQNIIISNLKIKGVSISGELVTAAAIGVNIQNSTNVEVKNITVEGMNVGIHTRLCDNVRILFNKVIDMVIVSSGTTGYGINTDGSKNLISMGNDILNCERHAFYIGASTSVLPENQLFLSNKVLWNKVGTSVSSYQAGFKSFNSRDITFMNNSIEGTKQFFWFPTDVQNARLINNRGKNPVEHGVLLYGGGTTVKNKHLTFENNHFSRDTETSLYNGILSSLTEPGTEFITAHGNYFENFSVGISLVGVSYYDIGVNTFVGCKKGYFYSTTGGNFGMIQTPMLVNTPLAYENYKTNLFASGDTTPSVANSDMWEVNNATATTITTFDNGVLGQEISVYFILNNNTTLQNSTTLRLQGNTNFTAPASTLMKFKRVRDGWIETSRTNPTSSGRYVPVPTSATATGIAGDYATDANYQYNCYATNLWIRTAKAAW